MATIQHLEPGKWKARVSLGSNSAGTRRIKSKNFYGNERAVRKAAAAWEAEVRAEAEAGPEPELEAGDDDDPAGPTFEQVLRAYIKVTGAAKDWSPAHRRDREAHLADIAETPLAGVRINNLRRTDLADHLETYAAEPTMHGKQRGKASVRQRKIVLAAVVRYARADPDLEVRGNPAADLVIKDTGRTVAEREIPSATELARLIANGTAEMDALARAARQCRPGYPNRAELIRDAATLALLTGMRRGEISALRTTDVQHHQDGTATILVRSALQTLAGGGWALKRTKTDRHRRITITAPAAEILLRRQVANETMAIEHELEPPAAGFIFSLGWGEAPIMPDTITNWWEKVRELEPELGRLRFQDLRHARASELHAAGIHPAAVAAYLGHSTEISLGTYDHVRPGADALILEAIDQAWT
jgi:integrase